MKRAAAAVLALAALLPAIAQAQAYQCRVPGAPISIPRQPQAGPTRDVPITGFTLSLSWSPEYCRFREDSRKDARQCSGRDGRFGMVLHGLWPEGRGGGWPQYCPTRNRATPASVRPHLCRTPSASLLAHEWAKHGSCLTRRPETYFRIAGILYDSLRFPDFDRLSRQKNLTAGDVREAWLLANPAWDARGVGLDVDNRGWLEEIRLCYRRDYMPGRCDPRRFGPKDSTPVKIWRGL